jgi:tetratricopeptide (TPR) repeat protein
VQLLQLFKRYLDAEQILHDVEEQTALPPELVRVGADVALANQDAKEALRLAMRAVSPTSRDYRDYVWLGRIYHGTGQDLQAEEVLRKAVALGPDAPDAWIALAEQLTRMGKREAAWAIALEAKEKVSPRLAAYTEARCFEAMGLVDSAEASYGRALSDADVDFVFLSHAADFHQHAGQAAKAQPFLEALVTTGASAPAEYVDRARRQLASILAAKGSADYARALTLIDENLHKRPGNAADIRARAFIEAVQPSQRRQAIRVFEETARRQPLSTDEQLQLAQLFDADGEGARAREQVVALLTAQPENPQFLAYYVRLLIQGEEESQARDQLQKLERLEPDSTRTRELARKLNK